MVTIYLEYLNSSKLAELYCTLIKLGLVYEACKAMEAGVINCGASDFGKEINHVMYGTPLD